MGLFDFLAPKRETSTEAETARYVAAEEACVRAQARQREDAARQQAVLSIQGCADGEWDAARKRVAERNRRIRRAYR
jgi:hypothetical protein